MRYEDLRLVLNLAAERAEDGKGKERHAVDGVPFHKQAIVTEAELLGTGCLIYQIRKKALETIRMDRNRACLELLDVIVYAAAAYIVEIGPTKFGGEEEE